MYLSALARRIRRDTSYRGHDALFEDSPDAKGLPPDHLGVPRGHRGPGDRNVHSLLFDIISIIYDVFRE